MDYNSIEVSDFHAEPVTLYEFSYGPSTWRYGQAEVPMAIDGIGTFNPTVISDDGIVQSGTPDSEEVVIKLPRNLPVPGLFVPLPPTEPIYLIMRRANRQVTDFAPVIWIGLVKSMKQTGLAECELTCMMMVASFDRPGLRLGWQKSCPHALYDNNCKVNKAAYGTVISVASLNGAMIYSSQIGGLAATRYVNGFVEWANSYGVIERRAIEAQTPAFLALMEGTSGLSPGQAINVYMGCNRNTDNCKLFNNLANYGGFPHMPGKSPFDGSPVF